MCDLLKLGRVLAWPAGALLAAVTWALTARKRLRAQAIPAGVGAATRVHGMWRARWVNADHDALDEVLQRSDGPAEQPPGASPATRPIDTGQLLNEALPRRSQMCILVAEDNEINQKVIARVLTRPG